MLSFKRGLTQPGALAQILAAEPVIASRTFTVPSVATAAKIELSDLPLFAEMRGIAAAAARVCRSRQANFKHL